jgi:hypothetical protein
MSIRSSCLLKAEQCENLAAEAADSGNRASYEREARLWRGFAADAVNEDPAIQAAASVPIPKPANLTRIPESKGH